MPLRTPSYHTICTIAGAVLAGLFGLIRPQAVSFLDVTLLAMIGALIGNSLGEAPPDQRPRIHRGALAGVGVGVAIAIVRRGDAAASLVSVTLCLSGGAMVARFGRAGILYVLTLAAAGMAGGLAWGLYKDLPLLVTIGQGGLVLALLALIGLSLKQMVGNLSSTVSDPEKTRILGAADRYAAEIKQGQLTPSERIRRINEERPAANLQQRQGEDSSEES